MTRHRPWLAARSKSPAAFAVWLAVLSAPGWAAGAQPDTASTEIAPPDVFVGVGLVRDELELIRFAMGRPENAQPPIGVTGAAPREAYFQALTMFEKAERLCFEHTRQHGAIPDLPAGEIVPADVLEVVNLALDRVRRVKQGLGIEEQVQPRPRDPTHTPTDVFRSAVQANRQLNLLLEQRYAPSDVFQQVTRGVGYASRLLEQFPEAEPIPPAPAFEGGKRPADVYRRLLACFERIRRIARASGLQMLDLVADDDRIAEAEPSDVYDIASLLVSELAFLHAQLSEAEPPREVYFVGRKFPSHVYQRAGILDRQLVELGWHVDRHPDWLREGTAP